MNEINHKIVYLTRNYFYLSVYFSQFKNKTIQNNSTDLFFTTYS